MYVIRPIQKHDYPDLYQIAVESGHGFTSLPVNKKILQERITDSIRAFSTALEHAANSYLFVLEDTTSKHVVGTCGIEAAVGIKDAFYHYRLGKVVHHSRELNIHNTVATLTLCNDYTGASEICSLYLNPEHRQNNNGRLLSKVRFLFMAEFMSCFSSTVIAEMRGVSDQNGRSPFWNWLEESFFSIDFPTADYLTGIGKKVFIAELMPKHLIYVSLLSKAAQKSIGQVHEFTQPALHLLTKEGFSARGYIDIFDAGPTVECEITNIKSIQQSQKVIVEIDDNVDENTEKEPFLLSNCLYSNFRALQANAVISSKNIRISSLTANALQVSNNDWVRCIKQ